MKKGFCLLIWFITIDVFADSPDTSTMFYKAYLQLENADVIYVNQHGLDDYAVSRLLSNEVSIDVKAAICNCLGWNFEGNNHAKKFVKALLKFHRVKSANISSLTGDEALVYGYLLLLGDYFNPANAEPYLQHAIALKPKSCTCAMILALCHAQEVMDYNYCSVWKCYKEVDTNKSLNRDLAFGAIEIIYDYMKLYEDTCHLLFRFNLFLNFICELQSPLRIHFT